MLNITNVQYNLCFPNYGSYIVLKVTTFIIASCSFINSIDCYHATNEAAVITKNLGLNTNIKNITMVPQTSFHFQNNMILLVNLKNRMRGVVL